MASVREEQTNRTIEDELYGTASPTMSVFDPEDAALMQKEFDYAQELKDVALMPGYEKLLTKLKENASLCAQAERSYNGIDREKRDKLWLARVNADYALNLVQTIFNTAAETPRPVLTQYPQ